MTLSPDLPSAALQALIAMAANHGRLYRFKLAIAGTRGCYGVSRDSNSYHQQQTIDLLVSLGYAQHSRVHVAGSDASVLITGLGEERILQGAQKVTVQ